MRNKLWMLMILPFIILSACQNQISEETYYLLLKGESETWELRDYEVELTPDGRKTGDGVLTMKGENEYVTNSFRFHTYAVINGEKRIIHSGSISGLGDISEQTTGSIRGDNRHPVSFDEINQIFMTIEWQDSAGSRKVQERIELYDARKSEELTG